MIDSHINSNIDRILQRLKTIPENPGVYQHLDANGKVIYVGKARNLHKRVSQYFTHYDDKSAKIKMLIRNIYDIRVTVVATEVDALLLENNLIKQYQPRYNSLLKDDKNYPYLCLTHEDYPRLIYVRNRKNKGEYFGPYPNQTLLRELLNIIRLVVSYRTCKLPLVRQGLPKQRPCMKHQIGLCQAPCTGCQSYEEYQRDIEQIRTILRGDFGNLLDDLKKQMMECAKALRFEEADRLKRKIQLLEAYQSKSAVVGTSVKDIDVYSIVSDDKYAYVHIMRIKHGNIIYSFSSEVKKQLDESDADLLATLIPALHEQTDSSAKEIIVPFPVPELPKDYLKQTIPSRGDRKALLDLSIRNVEAYRQQCRHQRALLNPTEEGSFSEHAKSRRLLHRIQQELHLPELPINIECFDNSNIQGAYPVAAMVRFTNGIPNRKEYRKYNIKNVEGPDDYASMAEVVRRRYERLQNENRPLPQLLIVDGGEGQMEIARRVIYEELHLDIPIAGLAKDERHHTRALLYGFPPKEIGMKPTDPMFHLLEHLQNEVHRFAITFHKEKRSKGLLKTQLTDIPGVGEKTARELLLKFGSVKNIKLQTLSDLSTVIGPSKAKIVFDWFSKGQ